MPSYEAATEERPVTVSGDQPITTLPRQLAKRKHAPGAGRPPNPTCCGQPTKRLTTGSSIVRCEVCETTYGPGHAPPPAARVSLEPEAVSPKAPTVSPFAVGRRGPKPSSVLGAGLSARETEQLREELNASEPAQKAGIPVIYEHTSPLPGLNGDHATRAQERSKIPPSRPANNSRGEDEPTKVGEFTFYRGEPPPKKAKQESLTEAIRQLPTDGSRHLRLEIDNKTRLRLSDAIVRLRRRDGINDVVHYIAADRSCRVVMRIAAEGEAKR